MTLGSILGLVIFSAAGFMGLAGFCNRHALAIVPAAGANPLLPA